MCALAYAVVMVVLMANLLLAVCRRACDSFMLVVSFSCSQIDEHTSVSSSLLSQVAALQAELAKTNADNTELQASVCTRTCDV